MRLTDIAASKKVTLTLVNKILARDLWKHVIVD